MKIRNGYVSNSSSSSFVVVGYLFEDKNNKKAKEILKFINPKIKNCKNKCNNDNLCCFIGNEDNGFDKGKTFVGMWYANIDDSYELTERSDSFEEIINKINEVKHLVPQGEKIKIITGNRLC